MINLFFVTSDYTSDEVDPESWKFVRSCKSEEDTQDHIHYYTQRVATKEYRGLRVFSVDVDGLTVVKRHELVAPSKKYINVNPTATEKLKQTQTKAPIYSDFSFGQIFQQTTTTAT